MAYNQYNNQGGYNQQSAGYGQYDPYGQSGNPYGQTQGNPYGQSAQPYGHTGNYSERPDLEHHSSSRYDEESAQPGSYEMSNMNGRDPNRILNEVRNIDSALDQSERDIERLRELLTVFANDTGASTTLQGQVDKMSDELLERLKNFVSRVNTIRQDPEARNSRNQAQVGKLERRTKAAINSLQQADHQFRKITRANFERQYRIVRPDASHAEVEEALESTGGNQIFSQTLLNSDRRGEVRDVDINVRQRHKDIQKIEKQMAELAQLFNDLEALVVQQEPAVAQIEEKGQEAAGHVAQANTELDGAVKKAKAARRKKWYCLGIALLIIIIIVVIVVVVVEVTKH